MNTLTKLAAPLVVATLSTTAPAVQAEPIVHKLDSLSYVQKNLIAQWDGIENKARGEHDSSITYWKDLTGNGYDFDTFDANASFSDNAFVPPSRAKYGDSWYNWAAKNANKTLSSIRAFDIYIEKTELDRRNTGHAFCLNLWNGNGSFIGLAYTPDAIQFNNGEAKVYNNISGSDLNRPHHFYVAYGDTTYQTIVNSCWIDGVDINYSQVMNSTKKGAWGPQNFLMIGNTTIGGYEPCANFYGMRVYSAALTPTQAKLNYVIDRKRFSNIEETLPEGYEWVGEEDARDIVIKNGITIGECQNGSIVMEGVPVVSGTYDISLGHGVVLSAQANEGYVFAHWEASDAAMLAGIEPTSSTVTLKGTDIPLGSIWAVFDKLEDVKMKLILTPSDFGTITTDPVGEDLGSGAWAFVGGTEVTLTATPKEGFTFVAWGGDASGSTPTTTVKMDCLRTVQAIFKDANGRFHTEWGYSNVVKVAGVKRCILAFTKVGKQYTLPIPSNVREMDYLIVGGGGGGGGYMGGGGGAGGLIAANGVAIAKGTTLSVLVGAGGVGGVGGVNVAGNGGKGSISTLSYGGTSLSADGGGAGGGGWKAGGNGGSGGGCGCYTQGLGGSATQGNKGGDSKNFSYGAGGGGADGEGGDNSGSTPGVGGLGFESFITGESAFYAAGGGGGAYKGNGAAGGSGIGGNANGGDGVDGTGSGGGGAGEYGTGGKGGDGIVIVSHPVTAQGLVFVIY